MQKYGKILGFFTFRKLNLKKGLIASDSLSDIIHSEAQTFNKETQEEKQVSERRVRVRTKNMSITHRVSIHLRNLHRSFSSEVVDPDHMISAAGRHEHTT